VSSIYPTAPLPEGAEVQSAKKYPAGARHEAPWRRPWNVRPLPFDRIVAQSLHRPAV